MRCGYGVFKEIGFWELKNFLERVFLRVKLNRKVRKVGRSYIRKGLEYWGVIERF